MLLNALGLSFQAEMMEIKENFFKPVAHLSVYVVPTFTTK